MLQARALPAGPFFHCVALPLSLFSAGLHYSTSPEGYSGVELRVDGFSHKLPVLAQRLLRCAAGCEVSGVPRVGEI